MWWLELALIGTTAYVAWRLYRLELKVEALEEAYNALADMFDERNSNSNGEKDAY